MWHGPVFYRTIGRLLRPATLGRAAPSAVLAIRRLTPHAEGMEYFTVDGVWWLPGSPDHRVPGTLAFDADGLALVVYGSLVPTVPAPGEVLVQEAPNWETTPVILGRTYEGRKLTLLDAGGANLIGSRVTQSSYRPRMALTGVHTKTDQFIQAWCEFDYLNAWADPPSLTDEIPDFDNLSLRAKSVDLGEVQVGVARIRLVAGVDGRVAEDKVDLEQRVKFSIDFPLSSSRSTINEWVRPLQDLLIFALGRPVRLTNFRLQPRRSTPREHLARAYFEAIQPSPSPDQRRSSIVNYSAPTILTLRDSPLPFATLLKNWFALHSALHEVLTLLHAPYYAPFMSSEHSYSSIFQSAEALAHADGFSGREKSRKDHKERLEAIISAARKSSVDQEAIEWAERILRSRNDKPLADQIQDLVRSTGAVGQKVIEASPTFGKIAAGARAGVSHPGAQHPLNATGRFWYGDVLRWIVRARVLIDLGLSASDVERRILSRASFQNAIDEIRAQ
jgi:ApeA N-terminal domain 1